MIVEKNPYAKGFFLNFKTILIGTGVRNSCLEKRVQRRPRRRKCVEGGSPAESECMELNATVNLYKSSKNHYYGVCLHSEVPFSQRVLFLYF